MGFVLERRDRDFSRVRQETNGKAKAWIFVILLLQCKSTSPRDDLQQVTAAGAEGASRGITGWPACVFLILSLNDLKSKPASFTGLLQKTPWLCNSFTRCLFSPPTA